MVKKLKITKSLFLNKLTKEITEFLYTKHSKNLQNDERKRMIII